MERSRGGVFVAPAVLKRWESAERRFPGWLERHVPYVPRRAVAMAALVLVTGFAGQLLLLVDQAGHDGARPPWFASLPYLLVDDDTAFGFGSAHWLISIEALALVLLQSAGLATILAALGQRDPGSRAKELAWRLLLPVAAIMGVLALWAPAVSSADIFGYVGLGMLGDHPFARPAHFFTGEYARFFGLYPLRPTIYGPLWIGLNDAVVSLGHGFAAKLFALRVLGVALLIVLAALVWTLSHSRSLTAAVALNPMLWLQFVVNAHNDLLAVALVAAGVLLVARRQPLWAIAPIAAAGLVKLPFLLLGAVAFGRLGRMPALACSTAALAICMVASAAFGGHAYVESLLVTASQRGAHLDPILQASKAVMALTPVAVTAFVLLRGRYPAFGGWLYPALAPVLFPWYLVWALPYALAARAGALLTLLALPVAGALVDTIYDLHAVAIALFALGGAALIGAVARQAPEALEPASG